MAGTYINMEGNQVDDLRQSPSPMPSLLLYILTSHPPPPRLNSFSSIYCTSLLLFLPPFSFPSFSASPLSTFVRVRVHIRMHACMYIYVYVSIQ